MNLKLQLKILSFLQFCLWGSWLTTLGSYMFGDAQVRWCVNRCRLQLAGYRGGLYANALLGIVADKWLSAKWLYMLLHQARAGTVYGSPGHPHRGDVYSDPA